MHRLARRGLVLALGLAVPGHRAYQALRIARQAEGCAQLHQCLVEISWPVWVHQFVGQFLDLAANQRAAARAAACLPAFHPAQHPLHIAVHHGHWLAVGDAGDGRGRVSANARQQTQIFRRGGNVALVAAGHTLRRFMQHPRPPVVAQPAPRGQHLLLVGERQRIEGGKPGHERLVALHHHRHAGLLQHDLGDPDGVGVAAAPPRQVAPAAVIPLQQSPAHIGELCRFPVLLSHAPSLTG